VQKQSIINDYKKLIGTNDLVLKLDDMDTHHFQSISAIETDPSQQSILNSLKYKRNILIQGPPGTGKSQSLTAILINALENHKKCLVVCEKRTALEVLYDALNNIGLSKEAILIKDITRDRRAVVDSVRDRIDNSEYNYIANKYYKDRASLDATIDKINNLILKINERHRKLGKELLSGKNWTYIVGELLKNLKNNTEEYTINLEEKDFKYTIEELNDILEIIDSGNELYNEYRPFKETTFLNYEELNEPNPYLLENKINQSYDYYEKELSIIEGLIENYKNEYKIQLDQKFNNTTDVYETLLKNLQKFYIEVTNKSYKINCDTIIKDNKTAEFDYLFQYIKNKTIDSPDIELIKNRFLITEIVNDIDTKHQYYLKVNKTYLVTYENDLLTKEAQIQQLLELIKDVSIDQIWEKEEFNELNLKITDAKKSYKIQQEKLNRLLNIVQQINTEILKIEIGLFNTINDKVSGLISTFKKNLSEISSQRDFLLKGYNSILSRDKNNQIDELEQYILLNKKYWDEKDFEELIEEKNKLRASIDLQESNLNKMFKNIAKYENEIIKKELVFYNKIEPHIVNFTTIIKSNINNKIERKNNYIAEFRSKKEEEIKNDLNKLNNYLYEISKITSFYNNKLPEDLKINSIKYRLQAIFSKQKRDLRGATLKYKKTIRSIEKLTEHSIYIKKTNFSNTRAEQKNEINDLAKEYKTVTNSITEIINKETEQLNKNYIFFNDDNPLDFTKIREITNELRFDKVTEEQLSSFSDSLIEHDELFKSKIKENYNELDSIKNFAEKSISGRISEIVEHSENQKAKITKITEYLIELNKNREKIIQNNVEKIKIIPESSVNIKPELSKTIQKKTTKLLDKVKTEKWDLRFQDLQKNHIALFKLKQYIVQKKEYFDNDNDIFFKEFEWRKYYYNLSTSNRKIIDQLKEKKKWSTAFIIFYLKSLLLLHSDEKLQSGNKVYEKLCKEEDEFKTEQLNYIRCHWHAELLNATREFYFKHSDLSVENLYNKRSSRNYKRLSLRQIVNYDTDLFTTFFPIILTTPDGASNLFMGKNEYFDIVLFDEASQLRIEDNLPALLKGKQIIIAGDEHQMPPSNYFSKIFDGSIEEEDDDFEEDTIHIDKDELLLSTESLLDFGTELNFEKQYLDFHYRSKHPYLIDFSNVAFYNKRLKPLPNTLDYTPIKYIQVNGRYIEHSNDAEADAIISILERNINRLPNGKYPTVGIATFNISHRNLIIRKINDRKQFEKYETFNQKIQELEENGFFVKNLENIQGDERDIIILSTTYGINKDNQFNQRFGPINQKKGYKLLNVIITRAKYKIYVVTSIPERVFLNYRDFLIAEGANNKRAVFYAYLAYAKAVSENKIEQKDAIINALSDYTNVKETKNYLKDLNETPFEEEVYQIITEHFGKSKAIINLQYAGFKIDIAYDSGIKGIPKIAIECDGTDEHLSREAYLHDIHRQKILEANGFVFHRIWSEKWWRNKEKEKRKLIDFITTIETTSKTIIEQEDPIEAFTDDFTYIYDYIAEETIDYIYQESNKNQNTDIDYTESDNQQINETAIKLNSKVKIKPKKMK
jgi:superfamily I DNA and/or RNA helicase